MSSRAKTGVSAISGTSQIGPAPHVEGGADGAEIDLGLSAAGDALEKRREIAFGCGSLAAIAAMAAAPGRRSARCATPAPAESGSGSRRSCSKDRRRPFAARPLQDRGAGPGRGPDLRAGRRPPERLEHWRRSPDPFGRGRARDRHRRRARPRGRRPSRAARALARRGAARPDPAPLLEAPDRLAPLAAPRPGRSRARAGSPPASRSRIALSAGDAAAAARAPRSVIRYRTAPDAGSRAGSALFKTSPVEAKKRSATRPAGSGARAGRRARRRARRGSRAVTPEPAPGSSASTMPVRTRSPNGTRTRLPGSGRGSEAGTAYVKWRRSGSGSATETVRAASLRSAPAEAMKDSSESSRTKTWRRRAGSQR